MDVTTAIWISLLVGYSFALSSICLGVVERMARTKAKVRRAEPAREEPPLTPGTVVALHDGTPAWIFGFGGRGGPWTSEVPTVRYTVKLSSGKWADGVYVMDRVDFERSVRMGFGRPVDIPKVSPEVADVGGTGDK